MHGLVSSYMSCLQRTEKTFWKRCENRNRLSGQHRHSKPLYMQVKQPLCSGEIKKKNKLTKKNNFLRLLSYQFWSSEKSDVYFFSAGCFKSLPLISSQKSYAKNMRLIDKQLFSKIWNWNQLTISKFLMQFLKVSKSWEQILKFSLESKNKRKYFCISALTSFYKKRSNQKSSVRESK